MKINKNTYFPSIDAFSNVFKPLKKSPIKIEVRTPKIATIIDSKILNLKNP